MNGIQVSQMRAVDCRTLGCKTLGSGLKRFQTRCGQRLLLNTGANDARAAKDHDAKRLRLQHEEPMQQEPSSGSGRKRSLADDDYTTC